MSYNPEHGVVPTEICFTPESLAIRVVVDDMYDRLEPWVFEVSDED